MMLYPDSDSQPDWPHLRWLQSVLVALSEKSEFANSAKFRKPFKDLRLGLSTLHQYRDS